MTRLPASWRRRGPRRPPPPHVFDEGLQQERTALAWDRTGLSLVVVALLYLRGAGAPFVRPAQLPAYLGLALGTSMLFLGARRYAHLHEILRGEGRVDHHTYLAFVWISVVLLGVASLVTVLAA